MKRCGRVDTPSESPVGSKTSDTYWKVMVSREVTDQTRREISGSEPALRPIQMFHVENP